MNIICILLTVTICTDYVMRKGDDDWVKKCMEYRVEGRRPVGRPRKTWLESVEADMPNLRSTKKMSMIEGNGEGM